MSVRSGSLLIQSVHSGKTNPRSHSVFRFFRRPSWHSFWMSPPALHIIPLLLLFVAWAFIAAGQWWVLEGSECAGWILWGVAHQSLSASAFNRRCFFWVNFAGSALVAWGQTQGVTWELQAMNFPPSVAGGITLAVAALWTGMYLLPWLFLVLFRFRRTPAAVLAGVIGMDWLRRQAMGYDWVGFTLWGWDTWVTAGVGSGIVLLCVLWLARFFTHHPALSFPATGPGVGEHSSGLPADTISSLPALHPTGNDGHLRHWGRAWISHIAIWLPVLLGWSFVWPVPPSSRSPVIPSPEMAPFPDRTSGSPPSLLVVVETFAPVDHVPDWTPALRGRLRRRLESIQSMLDRHMAESQRLPPESLVVWPEWGREVVSTPLRGVTVSPFYTLRQGAVAAEVIWQRDGFHFGARGKWLLTPIGERPCLGMLAPPATPYAQGQYPAFLFWQGYCIQSLLCVEGLHPDFWSGPADILTISANWRLLSPHHRQQFRAILARRTAQTGKTAVLAAHGHPALVLTPEGPLSPLWVSEMIPDDHQPLWVRFRVFELPSP